MSNTVDVKDGCSTLQLSSAATVTSASNDNNNYMISKNTNNSNKPSTHCTSACVTRSQATSSGNNGGASADQLRRDLARQLDRRIGDFGGSISSEWDDIKRYVAGEITANLADAVRVDVEALLEHPQLRELVRKLRTGRTDSETQAEVLDKMTATMMPKVRRNHQQFLDRLNQQVSQMIIKLMRNDQLAAAIDNEELLHNLFRLAASDDEISSHSLKS